MRLENFKILKFGFFFFPQVKEYATQINKLNYSFVRNCAFLISMISKQVMGL